MSASGDVREKDQTRQHFPQTRAVGALFLSMTTEYSQAVYALLFGEVRGISSTDLAPVAAVSAISVALAALLYRPPLLSSISSDLAEARGVPARRMEVLFLTMVALTAAMALPVVGALLVFSLMVGPPSAARALTDRPLRAIAGISVMTVGASIALSFASDWPIGFFVGGLSAVAYGCGRIWAQASAVRQ